MPSIRQAHALHRVFGVDPWRFLRLSRPLVPEEPIEETHKPHVVFVTFLGWDVSLEAPEEIGPFLVEFPTELLVVLGREFCLGFLLQFRLDVLEIAQLLASGVHLDVQVVAVANVVHVEPFESDRAIVAG